MAARPGPRVQQGYPAAFSPPNDPRDPFASSNAVPQRRYYDNESDIQDDGRTRDTYGSDSSQGPHDGERYYDNNGYDSYSKWSASMCFCHRQLTRC
jgi:1,3-beta-glucan synthase